MRRQHRTLVIVMKEPIRFHLAVEEDVALPLSLDGAVFSDVGYGDWMGFYDWLRTSSGKLVGIRTRLDAPGAEDLRQRIARNDAVDLDDGEIRVWFSSEQSFSEEKSDDQELGTHRVLTSHDGLLALTFNVESLSDEEFSALSAMVA
jgi:hypothetical protein